MRVGAELEFDKSYLRIPKDYRKNIMALLKGVFDDTEIYSIKSIRPFVWSIKFYGKSEIVGDYIIFEEGRATLYFSSYIRDLVLYFYDKLDSNVGSVFGTKFEVKRMFFVNMKKITEKRAFFKTQSPIAVRDFVKGTNRTNGYLDPESPIFEKTLVQTAIYSYMQSSKQEGGWWDDPGDVKIKIRNKKTSIIRHYGVMTACTGVLEITGSEMFLNFINNNGIGAARGQGFGMLGVI